MDIDVFISHSDRDAISASAACAALEAAKIRCWIAPRDTLPDVRATTSTIRAIDQGRVMVLIFSSNANGSEQICREVDRAFNRNVPVIPLRIENVVPNDELAFLLNTVHWLDALTPRLEDSLQRLVAIVRALISPRGSAEGPTSESKARQRETEEQTFAAAKGEDTVKAVEEFLSRHPDSHLAPAANALRGMLVARDEVHAATLGNTDPVVLRAFLDRYPVGKPAQEVGQRLERIESARRPSRRTILITGGVLAAGATASVPAIRRFIGVGPIRTFVGHSDIVHSVAISPDGRTALSASKDNSLKLWDVANGSLLRTFTGQTELLAVAIAKDGRSALAGGMDGTLRLWDLGSGNTIRTFRGHTNGVLCVAIAPDGRTGVSGSHDKTIRLWNLANGSAIRAFMEDHGSVRSIALAPDGRTALSGTEDGTVRLWDLTKPNAIRVFTGHIRPINSVVFASDGRNALSGGDDGTIKLWDVASGSSLRTFTGHDSYISSLAVTPDNLSVLLGSWDRTLRLWNLADATTIRKFAGHTGYVSSVAIAPDGRFAVSGSWDKTVKIWDLT